METRLLQKPPPHFSQAQLLQKPSPTSALPAETLTPLASASPPAAETLTPLQRGLHAETLTPHQPAPPAETLTPLQLRLLNKHNIRATIKNTNNQNKSKDARRTFHYLENLQVNIHKETGLDARDLRSHGEVMDPSLPSVSPFAVLWRYKFSQLKGSLDDSKRKIKFLFQNADTKQIEAKVNTSNPSSNLPPNYIDTLKKQRKKIWEPKKLNFKNYQFVLALTFAVEEINKNPALLHNVTLGFDISNVQIEAWKAFKNPFVSFFGKYNIPNYSCKRETKAIAVLTGPSGLTSAKIGTFLDLYRFPQVRVDSESDCITWANCPRDASLDWLPGHIFDMTMSGDSYNIYNAVYAVAQALHEMLLHQAEVQTMGNRKEAVPSPAQLHPFLKNIHFHNPAGDQVILDEKRKLEAEYDIMNIWNFPEGLELKLKVGKFSPCALQGQQLSLSEDMIKWAIGTTEPPQSVCSESCGPGFRKSTQEGKAACCFDCTPCSEDGIANETAVVLGVFVKHHHTPIVKANNQALSYILLLSLIFCFLCSLLFIGHPNTVTCILQQMTFGVAFTVAVSTVLAKTVTVVLAFKVTSPGRRMRWLLVSGAPNFIIPICTLIQMTLCGIWLGTSPPFIDTDAHSEHGHLILLCNKGSLTAFYCVLGYLGSLALASFTVAFLSRNLPDTFNEAKFLTFSMLVFCSVWFTFLPVYHSAKSKVMVAVEVFSILASSAGLLGCIFVPKCYIILIRPDRNVLHGFRDKTHTHRNTGFLEERH
ncbi:vomeronasal type-2 receptor 116-like [Perognathus longimembris pacificus]|uniref:vomeronasal type-2 receptor 116-like n=1 Tax=Perognathus longimembris pacificus TaxID=214514 RepID=UPI0020198DE9|nr:vomeronasal type-2 receptor 116-like [Perognathus longimembris pacificus]